MRLGLVVAAFAALVVPSVSYAADRVCSGIALLSPAQGQHFIGSRPIHFSWSGEPIGTVTRDLHLAALDGSEVVIPLDGRFSDTVKVKMTGDLAWAVVFRDADGKVLCSSPAGLIAAGSGGGKNAGGSGGSLSGTVAGAPVDPRLVVGFTNNGRLVIVLQNSPYSGLYSKLIASDNYDGTNENLMGAIGLEIYGNNANNRITGSPGADILHMYGGNDNRSDGGAGNDDVFVGTGTTVGFDPAGNDIDRYFVKDGGTFQGSLADGDLNDKVFVEPSANFEYSNDDMQEASVSLVPVPSVPE
jgi:hypothetical protein